MTQSSSRILLFYVCLVGNTCTSLSFTINVVVAVLSVLILYLLCFGFVGEVIFQSCESFNIKFARIMQRFILIFPQLTLNNYTFTALWFFSPTCDPRSCSVCFTVLTLILFRHASLFALLCRLKWDGT